MRKYRVWKTEEAEEEERKDWQWFKSYDKKRLRKELAAIRRQLMVDNCVKV